MIWFVASLPSGSFGFMMVSVAGFTIATVLLAAALNTQVNHDDRRTPK